LFPEGDEAIGGRIRKRLEQDRMHDAKDSCVRARTQSQGQDGNRAKATMLQQLANRKSKVIHARTRAKQVPAWAMPHGCTRRSPANQRPLTRGAEQERCTSGTSASQEWDPSFQALGLGERPSASETIDLASKAPYR